MEGVRFTEGSLLHAERIAEENAPLVAQLESKGAIIVGKTNVPEFCAGWGFFDVFCQNPSFFEKELRSDAKAQSLVLGMLLNVGLLYET